LLLTLSHDSPSVEQSPVQQRPHAVALQQPGFVPSATLPSAVNVSAGGDGAPVDAALLVVIPSAPRLVKHVSEHSGYLEYAGGVAATPLRDLGSVGSPRPLVAHTADCFATVTR
jgi:hypothetical protein